MGCGHPGIAVELLPMRLQYPPHTARADVVLLMSMAMEKSPLTARCRSPLVAS